MSNTRYQQVKQALLRARELDAAAQRTYLDELQALDPELCREVEALLAQDRAPARIVETGALAHGLGAGLAPMLESVRQEESPAQIGPYAVLGVLGEGGMGIVYRAEQSAPLRRMVAIKVIRRGLDTDRVVARFDSERQALALMDHPSIAHVFDAGADPAGRPYFVMELVEGQPITEFCDAQHLNTRERLELFLQVCAAVQHAHQKGVIHRDLKPSNLLITLRDGVPLPKIIDFGIAKAISEPLTEHSLVTRAGELLGTPDYMSPEQAGALGGAVDTRTDVYSLGVVLYELLSGSKPYTHQSVLPQDLQRVVGQSEPQRPSTRVASAVSGSAAVFVEGSAGAERSLVTDESVSAARASTAQQLRRQLAGDLDTIVLMALRKEPDRRYQSVEQLSADIRRHLDGRPIAARPDTFTYRSSRFVRRHRVGVTATAAVALLLVGLVVTMSVQSARVARQRNRAREAEHTAREAATRAQVEAQTAEQVSKFLVELFSVSDPSEARGNTITAREILDRGAARVRSQLADQPAVQGRMMMTMGEVYLSLGLHDRARALLDSALVVQQGAGARPEDVAATLALLSTVRHDQGEYAAAESLGRRSLALREQVFGAESAQAASSTNDLAVTLQAAGRLAEAEPLYRRALELNRKLLGADDPEVAWDMNTLGQVLYARGDYAGAEALFRDALAIQRHKLDAAHPDIPATLNNLGGVLLAKGDAAGAEPVFREALGIYQKLYGVDHAAVARAMHNLGLALRAQGRSAEAERLFRDALTANRRLLGNEHPYVANAMNSLALALNDRAESAQAERLLRAALAMRRNLLGEHHRDVGITLHNLGTVLQQEGRHVEAEQAFVKALAVLRGALPEDHPQVATTLVALGSLRLERGDPSAALPLLREGLAIRVRKLPATHWQIPEAESALGGCLATLGQPARAESLLTRGYDGLRRSLGSARPETRTAAQRLAKLGVAGG